MQKKTTKAKAEPKNKPTLVAFLLDRTGSMSSCREETIKGFNGYIDKLRADKLDMVFTLTQFDSIGIDIIHDAVPLSRVVKLNEKTYEPRANTPLYDAIGKTIRATEKSAGAKYKVLFVTLTDGLENASSEWTRQLVNELIKEKESKDKWTFAHIGVDINGFNAGRTLYEGTQSMSNVAHFKKGDEGKTYAKFAATASFYARSAGAGGQCVSNLWAQTPDSVDEPKKKK